MRIGIGWGRFGAGSLATKFLAEWLLFLHVRVFLVTTDLQTQPPVYQNIKITRYLCP